MTDTHAVDRTVDHVPERFAVREVVVGYDATAESETALRWAAGQAVTQGASLTVLHVEPSRPARAGRQVQEALRRRSAEVAAEGVRLARAAEPTVAVRGVGVVGGAAAELIARSAGAGLLVVGRRRRGHVLVAALGSVSFAVSLHALCPVVVCPPGTPVAGSGESSPSRRAVVVGVDGSTGSTAAVELAGTLAAATHSPVSVVGAWHGPSTGSWDEALSAGTDELARTAAREHVDAAVGLLRSRHPGLEVDGSTVQGDAVDVLVAASFGVAVVVVGSRGHGGFAGMMLGSVSHGVLRAAGSPVAVVRRGALA